VAVSDEGPHAARLGERERFAVVALCGLGVETVGMGRDVTKQAQGVGRAAGLRREELDRPVGVASRFVEPAAQKPGAPSNWSSQARRILPRSTTCSASRSRSRVALASPSCAKAKAEPAIVKESDRTTFPVLSTAIA
jgi:hypothetical protein